MAETDYQAKVIKRLRKMFPGCVILKNDSGYMQGIPDLSIFYGPHWAFLEVKVEEPGPNDFEPNQEWYIEELNKMSFAACIFPENEEEVLRAVQSTLVPERQTRLPKPEPVSLDPVFRR